MRFEFEINEMENDSRHWFRCTEGLKSAFVGFRLSWMSSSKKSSFMGI